MKIAILSGKGGAGKTMAAVNLAAAAERAIYIDCDVEEPNGRLFWQPENVEDSVVSTPLPAFDPKKCTGCKKCVEFCRFNALIYIKEVPKVYTEVCHSCGGCRLVCPEKAITETQRPVGHIEKGQSGNVTVVTGVLNTGEASGIPVIKAALRQGAHADVPVIIDCPPGSACSVTESISGADYCILVAEPTAFGFHNFQMVHELAALLGKPCGVIVNKEEAPYEPLETFCKEKNLPILGRIPFSPHYAALISKGKILAREVPEVREQFRTILAKIGGMAQ